jgi:hypothetical protein
MSTLEELLGDITYAKIESELRERIAKDIEAIPVETSLTNAIGMKIQAAKVVRGIK